MGYNSTASTTTLTAKLTPIGRQKLVTKPNLITSFVLGDSDANYFTTLPLTTGEVPSSGGGIGTYGSTSNSVGSNIVIKSMLLLNNGITKKAVEPLASEVTVTTVSNGYTTVDVDSLTQDLVSRANINSDPLVNLYYSFNLPVNTTADYTFTGLTSSQGGFSNTALSGLASTSIGVLALNDAEYGETLDGKSIKLDITTTVSTYTLYSTYQNVGTSLPIQDANYTDNAQTTKFLGNNIALLFCDSIQKPNNDSTLSWATGWGTVRPFSLNNKQLYNLTNNTNLNQVADVPVGIVYLDKGFIVLTHPTLVDFFDATSTATTLSFNSISTSVVQNITCISNRGEFATSTNSTFRYSDTPRISEVGLYDDEGNLIALAKTDRHLIKNVNEFLALGIKIQL